jgi:hypothetical protein
VRRGAAKQHKKAAWTSGEFFKLSETESEGFSASKFPNENSKTRSQSQRFFCKGNSITFHIADT